MDAVYGLKSSNFTANAAEILLNVLHTVGESCETSTPSPISMGTHPIFPANAPPNPSYCSQQPSAEDWMPSQCNSSILCCRLYKHLVLLLFI